MEKDFDFYRQNDDCNHLILFVHGFTGDVNKTWKNSNGQSFPKLLLANKYIADNFDVATYGYFTTLLDLFADSKEKFRRIKNLIRRKTHKKEKNLDISELSNNLSNHLRITLNQYDNIYIVAHSMGGLITKNLISDELNKNGWTKIKLFLSLAVPHQGSDKAVLGGLISDNLQINNLNPVNLFINTLNQRWIDLDSKPSTKYFYGSYDEVVTKHSAVAIDKIEKDIISVAEDHNSISKPENASSIVCNGVVQFIEEAHKHILLSEVGYQKLDPTEQLDDELFVLKLLLAEIANETQEHAKELFFNAEYVRKLFRSKHDRKQLELLFNNIRQLYKDSFDGYLADDYKNSGQLLAEVHTKITDHDAQLLKTLIPTLQTYHKKGMLHQLANDTESDIWWSKSKKFSFEGEDK
ncbi:ABC-three component system protein [uncultured Shewanella sp.]|uniref:ABC-three component system protein n=1 Tax=uncultured Shewanella sp. TaxID=173975 RepID=UPI00260A645A|nr:ABC-three component system protein [uncultured Shewanella sp.]